MLTKHQCKQQNAIRAAFVFIFKRKKEASFLSCQFELNSNCLITKLNTAGATINMSNTIDKSNICNTNNTNNTSNTSNTKNKFKKSDIRTKTQLKTTQTWEQKNYLIQN